MTGDLALGQYAQYLATIDAVDHRYSPRLQGISVDVSSYPSDDPTVEPTESFGFSFPGRLLAFAETISTNPNAEVEYQISGDAGPSPRWFFWDPTGAGAWVDEAAAGGFGYPLNTSFLRSDSGKGRQL